MITNAVDWEKNGFEVIGEASNGEEALEFFEVNEPDLIVTDINMPFMDGVTLTENIRKRSKDCHIIMLTGYREFEYARKAVVLGVDEFLVKPINAEEVTRAAVASREKIVSERGQNSRILTLQKEAQDNRILLRDAFLQRLLEHRIEPEEAFHKLQMFQLTKLADGCVCVNANLRLKEGTSGRKKEYCTKLLEWARNNTTAEVCFMHYLDNLILLFAEGEAEMADRQANELLDYAAEMPETWTNIGISRYESGVEGIARAYQQTEKALSAGFIRAGNRCLHYDEYERIRGNRKKASEMNWKEVDMAMASGSWERLESCIDYYVMLVADVQEPETDYIKIMALEMAARASVILSKQGKSILDVVGEYEYYEKVARIECVADMELLLKEVLHQVLNSIEGRQVKKGTALIDNVQKFVNKNLGEPELGLRMVSQELYVNASYLSRVFKQEVGESLIEYITRKRIEKSMYLLDNTDMKAYEIADAVGIRDAHYFSICFKKYVGVTIKEYKTRV